MFAGLAGGAAAPSLHRSVELMDLTQLAVQLGSGEFDVNARKRGRTPLLALAEGPMSFAQPQRGAAAAAAAAATAAGGAAGVLSADSSRRNMTVPPSVQEAATLLLRHGADPNAADRCVFVGGWCCGCSHWCRLLDWVMEAGFVLHHDWLSRFEARSAWPAARTAPHPSTLVCTAATEAELLTAAREGRDGRPAQGKHRHDRHPMPLMTATPTRTAAQPQPPMDRLTSPDPHQS